MSVLIKGMKMPTSCAVCPFENYGDCYGGKIKAIMDIDDYVSAGKRHPRCPLVEIPPHGRLIDADAPIKVWEVKLSDGDNCSFRNINTTVSKFLLSHVMGEVPPTIIEAEESK